MQKLSTKHCPLEQFAFHIYAKGLLSWRASTLLLRWIFQDLKAFDMQEGSEDAVSGSFEFKPASRQQATSREVPARCKCGELFIVMLLSAPQRDVKQANCHIM